VAQVLYPNILYTHIQISCILYSDILYHIFRYPVPFIHISCIDLYIQMSCILISRYSVYKCPDILYAYIQIFCIQISCIGFPIHLTWIFITRYPLILIHRYPVYTFISKNPVLYIFYIQLLSALRRLRISPHSSSRLHSLKEHCLELLITYPTGYTFYIQLSFYTLIRSYPNMLNTSILGFWWSNCSSFYSGISLYGQENENSKTIFKFGKAKIFLCVENTWSRYPLWIWGSILKTSVNSIPAGHIIPASCSIWSL